MISPCGKPFGFIIHKVLNTALMLFLFWGMPKQIWLIFITWTCSDQIHYINNKLTKYCSSVLHFLFYFFNIQVLSLQSRNMVVLSFIDENSVIFRTKNVLSTSFYNEKYMFACWNSASSLLLQYSYFPVNNESRYRCSHQRCSVKKRVLRNFSKFTGKHLCQSLFFNKVAGATYFTEHLWTTASIVIYNLFLKKSFILLTFSSCRGRLEINVGT